MHSRWARQKKRIFEELGQHQVGGGADGHYHLPTSSSSSSLDRPIAGRATSRFPNDPPLSSLSMHAKLMSYDTLIRSLNQARLNQRPYPLASEFLRLTQSTLGGPAETQTQLAECWMAIASIAGELQGSTPLEREFSPAYFDPTRYYTSPDGRALRTRIAKGARAFLESQFETHLDNVIASNPSKAQLGGQPGIVARTNAYLRVTHLNRDGAWAPELELAKKSAAAAAPAPVWATIYYLLRTGHPLDALRQAEEHDDALRRGGDPAFVSWFKEWIESGGRGLSLTTRDRFFAEYNARFRSLAIGRGAGGSGDPTDVDPYKLALYRLIGRVDPARKFPNALTRSTENWLWLQLMMTREPSVGTGADGDDVDDDDDRQRYSIQDLSRKLRTYGEKHFDPKGRRPLHYFLVLLLSGEFERAVHFLYGRPQHQTDAVHFAIALSYYGLLRCPSPQDAKAAIGAEVLLPTGDASLDAASLDLARILVRHIRPFASSDARFALEYLYLICLPVEPAVPAPTQAQQRAKCYDAVRDLVCQTRMYTDLVGDVRVNGARVPGAIEQNLALLRISDVREYLAEIVRAAAGQSEAELRTRDAILLYNLAEEYEQVVSVLNRELGASLFLPDGPSESEGSGNDAPDAAQASASASALNPHASLSAAETAPQLARAILDTYESQNHIVRRVDASKRHTCRLLLELKRAVGLVRSGHMEKALRTLEAVDVFPLGTAAAGGAGTGAGADVVTISRRAESFFRDVDEAIARNLSELLLLAMDVLYKVHAQYKDSHSTGHTQYAPGSSGQYAPGSSAGASEGNQPGREAKLLELRNKARALMMFAGMLRFRIEQSVFAQMTRLDAFIR